MAGNPIYNTAQWKALRKQVLEEEPTCHWCHRAPSTQADHLIELDNGGDPYNRDNLVGSCASCNASRGARHVNRKTARRLQNRANAPTVFPNDQALTPSPHLESLGTSRNQPEPSGIEGDLPGSGRTEPRLITAYTAAGDFMDSVSLFAERIYGLELMDWQKVALAGQLSYAAPADRETGTLIHRSACISTARQVGKSSCLKVLASWWATVMAGIRGEPQTVMIVANEYERASILFREMEPVMAEKFGAKSYKSFGRESITFPDGSTIRLAAATAGKHGYSVDLLLVDEIWDIKPQVIYGALKPSQIARRSPLMSCWSTAGDASSTVLISMREQAIACIDRGEPSPMFFAEWSPPPGVSPADRMWWPWASPALGTTITWEGLEEAFATIPLAEFVRAHLNLWQGSVKAWIPNVWGDRLTDTPIPTGGVLAIETSLDESRYVAVRAVGVEDRIIVDTEFVVESMAAMWGEVTRVMADPAVQLRVPPGLVEHVPPDFRRRTEIVGYRELKAQTPIVRALIVEDRLHHVPGNEALAEHVNRAVMVKTNDGAPLSSQKSPGPIELARAMVWAAGAASVQRKRPKAAFAFGT